MNAEGSQPAYLIFDTGTLTYSGMLAIADQAPYEVRPQLGDQFIVDLVTITPEGEVAIQSLTDTPLTFGVQPFTFSYSPAVSGDYEVTLSMSDLAGNRINQKTAVQVNNDSVDGSLRGYTDTNEGIYFQYPFAWGESVTLTNDDDTITEVMGDDQGIQSLFVDSLQDSDPQSALTTIAGVDGSQIEETTLGGLPAYCGTYTNQMDDQTLSGAACSLVNPESGATVLFRAETLGDPQTNTDIGTVLDATLKFFKPI